MKKQETTGNQRSDKIEHRPQVWNINTDVQSSETQNKLTNMRQVCQWVENRKLSK